MKPNFERASIGCFENPLAFQIDANCKIGEFFERDEAVGRGGWLE